MSLRFKSLDDLGTGAWRVASVLSAPPPSAGPRSGLKKRAQDTGPTPHDLLWSAVSARWPDACRELAGVVPGRRYRLDIGFPLERLAVEVDGFAHHGKYLADFRRDRVRQNHLTVAGWRILRFAAGDIRADLDACMSIIAAALSLPIPTPPALEDQSDDHR